MQNLRAPKKESTAFKEKALNKMRREGTKTPTKEEKKESPKEARERLKKEKSDLKMDLLKMKDQKEKFERDSQNAYEDNKGLGYSKEELDKRILGEPRVKKHQETIKKIPETEKRLEAIDGEVQEVEQREKVLALVRKGKQSKLAKLREATKGIDDKVNELPHVTGISSEEVLEDWLRQNITSEKVRKDYLVNKKLQQQYEKELEGPDEEPEPRPKTTMAEEEKLRAAWRKDLAAFRPYKVFAERARAQYAGPEKSDQEQTIEERHGSGREGKEKQKYETEQKELEAAIKRLKEAEEKSGEAVGKAEEGEYLEAIKLLKKATTLAKEAQNALNAKRDEITEETKKAAAEQKEAFNFTTEVKDKEWGFDSDDDAKNFYLANSVDELGGLTPSPQLVKMKKVYEDCRKRKEQLQKMGGSIDEIVEAVYKNIPKNFWPDDVVKEVLLYKAVKAEIDAEEGLAESELSLDSVMEKLEAGPGLVSEKSTEAWEFSLMADQIKEKYPEAAELKTSDVTNALSHFSDICSALTDSTMGFLKGASALESHSELEETEDNPVKAKILEFQRNKALIECANSLMSAGMDVAGEVVLAEAVPLLGVISNSKNALQDIAGAVTYFKNLAYIATLKKGAAIDPRTASLMPLARQAREQKIAASDKLVSAVANMLQALGKSAELGAMSAPAGIVVDVTGKAIKYAGAIVIAGINWSDAAAAVKTIKLAAGPPPNRKSQIMVMKHSAKYARVALAQLARDGDPWAMGHLENMGLGREDVGHPATSNKLLREYMALMSGGTFADGIGEEQKTFGETLVGRGAKAIARGIVKGAEKVRDLIVGRETGIPYDSGWRMPPGGAFTPGVWQTARKDAIAAGWYDSRPEIEADLAAYVQARGKVDGHLKKEPEGKALNEAVEDASALIVAVVAVRNHTRSIKAVANDRVTPHAGMAAFLDEWGKRADQEAMSVTKTRAEWIDGMVFKGKKGQELENAKKEFLSTSAKEAQEKQTQKAIDVRKKIDELWEAHKIPSPYGSVKINDFTDAAVKKLKLDEEAAKDLRADVGDLWDVVHERLSQEVMSAPDEKELEKRFKLSATTIDPIVVEGLRAASERAYQAMLKRTGETDGEDGWTPGTGDVALTAKAWASVDKAATEKGWKKGKSTGLTPALKNYEEHLEAFLAERNRQPQDPTALGQKQGTLLGRIDELVTALEDFQPLTEKQFNHPGLSAWRDGMIDLCGEVRGEYAVPLS